jgi:hypothetical protein
MSIIVRKTGSFSGVFSGTETLNVTGRFGNEIGENPGVGSPTAIPFEGVVVGRSGSGSTGAFGSTGRVVEPGAGVGSLFGLVVPSSDLGEQATSDRTKTVNTIANSRL